ncbi:probable serine/threonine-protein kinase yakA [Teleopsis dalmanni]|uniref:probable serine/threonine-protein kinase yakA n=1 Tax=Teleopsis dalmanni TaxID=139649 RepID=UPI0018CE5D83|nr:probable serine/threonine-protein kinase yakA [Teleopsis dalmanni]
MILPQKLWQLVLVLAFLLVQQYCAAVGTTENPYQTNAGIDKNFEVIDVAHQNLNGNKLQTGQTTRIFTAGNVDDNFWLKHLGDDFKHAIHLNVGNNNSPSSGYNLTNDGTPYKIEHEYLTNVNPVQYSATKQNEQPSNQAYIKSSNSSFPHYLSANSNNTSTMGETKQTPNINLDNTQSKPFEQVFTLDHSGINLAQRFYDPKTFDIPSNSQNNKYSQYDQLRPISPKFNQQYYQQKELANIVTSNINSAKQSSPVVITLPDTRKEVQHYGDSEKAVVVKLPPVIYHSKPLYTQESTHNSKDNQQKHTNTHLQSTQEKTNTNTQHSQTYKQHQNYPQLKHTQEHNQKPESHQPTYNAQYRGDSYHPSTSDIQKSYQHQASSHDKTHKEVRYTASKQSNTAIYGNSQKDSVHGATNDYKRPSRAIEYLY